MPQAVLSVVLVSPGPLLWGREGRAGSEEGCEWCQGSRSRLAGEATARWQNALPKRQVASGKTLKRLSRQSSTIRWESERLHKAEPWPLGTAQNLSEDERHFLE